MEAIPATIKPSCAGSDLAPELAAMRSHPQHRRRIARFAFALAGAALLAACGSTPPADPIFANAPTGADSRELERSLPEGLQGDRENARYLTQPLFAPGLIPLGPPPGS